MKKAAETVKNALCNSKLDENKNAGWRSLFVKKQLKEVMHPHASHDLRRILDMSFGSERPMVASTVSLSQSGHISTHNWGH